MYLRRLIFAALVSSLMLITGCADSHHSTDPHPIDDAAITEGYPELYKAVLNRDAGEILPFTSDSSIHLRRQAWRALAQTPLDSLTDFIRRVQQDQSEQAWFALSMHELSAGPLRGLEKYWLANTDQRAGVSRVLGRQGDEETLNFLLDQLDNMIGSSYEYDGALAISRLVDQFSAREVQLQQIIEAAFQSSNPEITRAWLYGFYRGGPSLSPPMQDSLRAKWQMGSDANVDQYIARILGPSSFTEITDHYFSSEPKGNVQLGIELAQLVENLELNAEQVESIKKLLRHRNPHVRHQALTNLTGRISENNELFSYINKEILADEPEPFVWLQALQAVTSGDSSIMARYDQRLNKIAEKNSYLYPQVLQVRMITDADSTFLNRLEKATGEGDPLKSMYAVNALNTFRSQLEQQDKFRQKIRSIAFDALAIRDRGVSYSVQPLLQDSVLFEGDDFQRINKYLNAFSLPGDIEVYQTFGSLYKQRFEQQAQPVIDSLAALGYVPLNRSLKEAGWDVEVPEDSDPEFRSPNWSRLWKMGKQPVWVLETEKGTIKVEMYSLSAPATVSAIDSLTRAGAYNGVPFHRVVPNFVIQGGDIEREDGFGGPDFTIPTEASEQGYMRGAAGIASAGPDTEGSQYFFMHQWKPHLNGRYTLFGNVVEGMDVVDRIVVGDKVERAYWK